MSHKDVYNPEQLDQFKKIDRAVIDAFVEFDPKKTLMNDSMRSTNDNNFNADMQEPKLQSW